MENLKFPCGLHTVLLRILHAASGSRGNKTDELPPVYFFIFNVRGFRAGFSWWGAWGPDPVPPP